MSMSRLQKLREAKALPNEERIRKLREEQKYAECLEWLDANPLPDDFWYWDELLVSTYWGRNQQYADVATKFYDRLKQGLFKKAYSKSRDRVYKNFEYYTEPTGKKISIVDDENSDESNAEAELFAQRLIKLNPSCHVAVWRSYVALDDVRRLKCANPRYHELPKPITSKMLKNSPTVCDDKAPKPSGLVCRSDGWRHSVVSMSDSYINAIAT